MPDRIKIFVSYSHQDADDLEENENSLLGFLKGLKKENIEFWTDRNIRPGELWDGVIKAQIRDSHIALVLISQGFLDSDCCQNTEIKYFLAPKTHLFPVILSPCEKSRQFLPGGDQTVEEHFQDGGRCKRLFLQIREQLSGRAKLIRQNRSNSALNRLAEKILSKQPPAVELLVFIDQFEELFTLVDPEHSKAFDRLLGIMAAKASAIIEITPSVSCST